MSLGLRRKLYYSSIFYWDVPLKWAFPHFHLATSFPFSNISTLEEMGWRRHSSRKVLNWHRCVTPSPSTPRAPMLSSRPLSPHSTPKVITHTQTSLTARTVWMFVFSVVQTELKRSLNFAPLVLSSQCMMGWASESPPMRRSDLIGVSLLWYKKNSLNSEWNRPQEDEYSSAWINTETERKHFNSTFTLM